MNVIQLELAVLIVVAVIAAVVLARAGWLLLDRIYDREKAIDQHVKSVSREAQRVIANADGAISDATRIREDARVLLERVDRHMADPRIKQALGG